MVHGRSNEWLLWARGAVLSTVTRSVLSLSGCGDGGDMAGRAQLREIGLPDLEDALGLRVGEGADEGS